MSAVPTLYLVFSHDRPRQLARLVGAIRQLSPAAAIAIHHDPQDGPLHPGLFDGIEGVHVIPEPIHGEWGDFSLVEQYLHALRWCAARLEFDWCCTLTGLSYPLRPLTEFEDFLGHSDYDAFIHHFDAFDPVQWPAGTAERRYLFAYYRLPRMPYAHRVPQTLQRLLAHARDRFNQIQPFLRIVPMPRRAPTRLGIRRLRRPLGSDFLLCGGRQMLTVNRHALARMLDFVATHPEWTQYARRSLIPDESFFNSILVNDKGLRVCNDVLRYIKWPKMHAASVSVIGADEVEAALRSGAPFGLKFDEFAAPEVLDLVDARLGIAPPSNPSHRPG
ncbi:N-acetylglucosaminyltransferase [Thauera sp.]|uniref:N-acetylglucosaminyltransferase n=1 Tax=Thauera sp. TaxID=1905334 RepID=UPI00260F1BEA|nr:N-acetylglucosaminyltransferase [Thauera sp.]MCK6409365.1 N-acetylglucosaminyltransferase [Thauera sp.]